MRTGNLTRAINKIAILAACTLLSTALSAQSFDWAIGFGNSDSESGNDVTSDIYGNLYSTGSFTGTVDFDPVVGSFYNLSSSGDNDCFVQKLDANGNLVWAKKIGGSNKIIGHGVTVDVFGNVYVSGVFLETGDFDPGQGNFELTAVAGYDGFVIKLDPSGNFLWVKQLGSAGHDFSASLDTDSFGNVYAIGHFRDFLDLGNSFVNLTSDGESDIFIVKFDPSGNTMWSQKIGGINIDEGSGIAVDAAGNSYIAAGFYGTTEFDNFLGTNQITSEGGFDILIAKLDLNGNILWAEGVGGTGNDRVKDIEIDAAGRIHYAGHFNGTVDFDFGPGTLELSSLGSYDAFVSKIDNSANLIWAKRFGGSNTDYCYGLSIDSENSVYATGEFLGTSDFDPDAGGYDLTSNGDYDIFVNKLDANGDFDWARRFGSSGADGGLGINVSSQGYVYVTGDFEQTVDFDPDAGQFNLTSDGAKDAFVLKLNQPTSNVAEVVNDLSISVLPNPSDGNINISFNKPINDVSIILSDIHGREVLMESFQSVQDIDLNIPGEPGIYLLSVDLLQYQQTIRVIKK